MNVSLYFYFVIFLNREKHEKCNLIYFVETTLKISCKQIGKKGIQSDTNSNVVYKQSLLIEMLLFVQINLIVNHC